MVQKIVWSDDAIETFGEAAKYLLDNFSQNELDRFEDKIEHKLRTLKSNPRLGRKANKRRNTYVTVINKRVVLYYQYKPIKMEIILLTFWNTLQNPKRLKI